MVNRCSFIDMKICQSKLDIWWKGRMDWSQRKCQRSEIRWFSWKKQSGTIIRKTRTGTHGKGKWGSILFAWTLHGSPLDFSSSYAATFRNVLLYCRKERKMIFQEDGSKRVEAMPRQLCFWFLAWFEFSIFSMSGESTWSIWPRKTQIEYTLWEPPLYVYFGTQLPMPNSFWLAPVNRMIIFVWTKSIYLRFYFQARPITEVLPSSIQKSNISLF